MRPHTAMALELLELDKKRKRHDKRDRLQITAITVFLAGIDKCLSLAVQMLYLAGKIGKKKLKPIDPHPGRIECGLGFTQKVKLLEQFGADLNGLHWLAKARNLYIHNCAISAGYTIGPRVSRKPHFVFLGNTPKVSFSEAPVYAIGKSDLRRWSSEFTDCLGLFLDSQGWRSGWKQLGISVKALPRNPQPEYGLAILHNFDNWKEMLELLNRKYVGVACSHLLPRYTENRRRSK